EYINDKDEVAQELLRPRKGARSIEDLVERMHEHERADGKRPAQKYQHFEEPFIGKLESGRVAHEVDTEQRIDDDLNGQRHELEGLERLVRKRVPTDLSEGSELLKDQHARPEVGVGEKICEGEG